MRNQHPEAALGKHTSRSGKNTELDDSGASSSQSAEASLAKSRVNAWLTRLQLEGIDPTLDDLEHCRPDFHPPTHSIEYATKYTELVDTLCRSFSKAQLQKFVTQCGLPRRGRKKLDYAESIVEEKWGWPRLEEIVLERRDRTEMSSETFPVTPSQFFLILGRDGTDLLDISAKYKVHISLVREPLALRIEGLRGSMKKLKDVLNSATKNFVEESVQLPTRVPIRADLVQRISRLADAYIENIGDKGLIRIVAKDERSLGSAKRLASRASREMISSTVVPLISYLPAGVPSISTIPEILSPYMYAMYPFLSPRTLPWYMNTSGAFRIRRVGEWLTSTTKGENIKATGGLAGGEGTVLNLSHKPVDLRDALFTRPRSHSSSNRRIVKASTGHVLFTTQSMVQRATLRPPLKSSHQFAKILKWISQSDLRASFVPSLPPSLVHSVPAEQKILHRLIYKSLPPADQTPSAAKNASQSNVITFEVVIAVDSQASDAESVQTLSIDPRWQKGTETVLDLMMPDRSMDIRLTALDIETLSEDAQPLELKDYSSRLQHFLLNGGGGNAQPDPPLTLHAFGEQYMLHTSASVRQSVERLQSEEQMSHPIAVVSESILDLESSQRTTSCEIICDDLQSDTAWYEFLSGCDLLSTAKSKPSRIADLEGEE
ncbi:hypothetical protein PHLGIDRAFT_124010 [Phlebiopsis gigantea 11061_1 CR5-6]|uniref:Uncharacterized protein n=1 Tax=Phlebiopsis gigantea (strain 11061_1 CR5-6) TaxID=745531 RepID=A0A0C3SE70_PHLG1|nr:hypothetical protein PHLGIDRAFT_124010 [Phlebiopsis gigantea 11061_1 CR5-6]